MTSKRYTSIDSKEIALHLADHGWTRHSYAGSAPTKNPIITARHRVTFRNPAHVFRDATPEVILINSHDGSSSARLHLGIHTTRGRTTALPHGRRVAVRHRIDGEETLVAAIPGLLAQIGEVYREVVSMEERILSAAEQEEYARLAGQLRYNDGWTYDPATLLAPRWDAPGGDRLWDVFCRLHANLVRGGFRGVAASGHGVTALPLSCIERDAKFNATFWQLTQEMI